MHPRELLPAETDRRPAPAPERPARCTRRRRRRSSARAPSDRSRTVRAPRPAPPRPAAPAARCRWRSRRWNAGRTEGSGTRPKGRARIAGQRPDSSSNSRTPSPPSPMGWRPEKEEKPTEAPSRPSCSSRPRAITIDRKLRRSPRLTASTVPAAGEVNRTPGRLLVLEQELAAANVVTLRHVHGGPKTDVVVGEQRHAPRHPGGTDRLVGLARDRQPQSLANGVSPHTTSGVEPVPTVPGILVRYAVLRISPATRPRDNDFGEEQVRAERYCEVFLKPRRRVAANGRRRQLHFEGLLRKQHRTKRGCTKSIRRRRSTLRRS